MHSQFLTGFANELVKTAAPSMGKLKAGGTMLGQRVKNMAKKVVKRAKGIRSQTKGGTGLKGVVAKLKKKASVQDFDLSKVAEFGDETGEGGESEEAGDILRAIIEEAQARLNEEPGVEQMGGSTAEDASYGTGTGKPPSKPKKKMARKGF